MFNAYKKITFIIRAIFLNNMFKISSQDKEARAGTLKTRHGIVKTPFFMPIATKGTPKAVSPKDRRDRNRGNNCKCICITLKTWIRYSTKI